MAQIEKSNTGVPLNTTTDLDSRLLAGRLREEKNKSGEIKKGSAVEAGADYPEGEGQESELKQLKIKAGSKEQVKSTLEKNITNPVTQATNGLLRSAWLTLLPSFGLSLVYINIHVFLRLVLGKGFFCKLGEEWLPKGVGKSGGIGIIEAGGVVLLDLVVLLIILAFLTLIGLMADIVENPLSYIGEMLGIAWDAVTGN